MRQEQPGPADRKDRQTPGKDAGPRRPPRNGSALRPPGPGGRRPRPSGVEREAWACATPPQFPSPSAVPAPPQPSLDGAGAALCVALRPARLPWRRAFVWPRRGRSAREPSAPPPPGEKEGGEDWGEREGGTRLRGRGWEGGAAGVPSVPRVSLGSEPLQHTALLGGSRPVAVHTPCLLLRSGPFPPPSRTSHCPVISGVHSGWAPPRECPRPN